MMSRAIRAVAAGSFHVSVVALVAAVRYAKIWAVASAPLPVVADSQLALAIFGTVKTAASRPLS